MVYSLRDAYKNTNPFNDYSDSSFMGYTNANSTPSIPTMPDIQTQTETLPNGGGTYNPAGSSAITPAAPVVPTPTETGSGGFVPTPGVNYDKYKDPKTGEIMGPDEYAIYLANKLPKNKNNQVPGYAGDAITDPNQTADQLKRQATDLNNARNDIAVGQTDPYKVGNKSGIAYSPAQLKAIESAYAGIYDPALKDVFERLEEKEASDKKIEDEEASRRATTFSTNEAIRKYWNTYGANKGGSTNFSGEDNIPDYSDSNLIKLSSAGIFPDEFETAKDYTYAANTLLANGIQDMGEDELQLIVDKILETIPPEEFYDYLKRTRTFTGYFENGLMKVALTKEQIDEMEKIRIRNLYEKRKK